MNNTDKLSIYLKASLRHYYVETGKEADAIVLGKKQVDAFVFMAPSEKCDPPDYDIANKKFCGIPVMEVALLNYIGLVTELK